MQKEIGSEFDLQKNNEMFNLKNPIFDVEDFTFTFSGRTAIDLVIENEKGLKKVLLPSYCCESMIIPFKKHNLKIEFYKVYYDRSLKIELPEETDADLILICNYFGFKNNLDFSLIAKKGIKIIEDITHSLFSNTPFHSESDYIIASLRKWGPLKCGGYCGALKNRLKFKPYKYPDKRFIDLKTEAMNEKYLYLNSNQNIDKNKFLYKFKMSNNYFQKNYEFLKIDYESLVEFLKIDYDYIKNKRIENARVLYNGLKNNDNFRFVFNLNEMDCPLFVPIICKNRENVIEKLIENNIYCPKHWPKPNFEIESNLYDMELSLVCDQRYNKDDMEKIVKILLNC